MSIYARLDVSDKTTHVSVVDTEGAVLRRDVPVECKGIELRILVFDKSARRDGAFERADVIVVVEGPRIFAIGNEHSNPDYAVEQVVNEAVGGALRNAEALLVDRLGSIWAAVSRHAVLARLTLAANAASCVVPVSFATSRRPARGRGRSAPRSLAHPARPARLVRR